MVIDAFKVATEFKFDVGSAVLSSEQLQGAVGKISDAADGAILKFAKLGQSIAWEMGFGESIMLGVIKNAVMGFEKFRAGQVGLANILTSNSMNDMQSVTEQTMIWNDALGQARNQMLNIAKAANEFALPVDQLLQQAKLLTPMIMAKGFSSNQAIKISTDISRTLLKSAGILGIDPTETEGQLMRMIEGGASSGDTLFRRLTADTSAMRKFGGGKTKSFNVLPAAQRIDIITQALNQFSKNSMALKEQINSVNGQMTLLKNNLTSSVNIFTAIGAKFRELFITSLKFVNNYLQTTGKELSDNLARLIGGALENPRKLLATLFQLKELKADTKQGSSLLMIWAAVSGLAHVAKMFGIITGEMGFLGMTGFLISNLFRGLVVAFEMLSPILAPIVATLLPMLGAALAAAIPPMLLIMGILQFISRAMGHAKLADAENVPKALAKLTGSMANLKNVFRFMEPLFIAFDKLAQLFGWIFEMSNWINLLNWIVEGLVTIFNGIVSAIVGFADALNFALTNILAGNFDNLLGRTLEEFNRSRTAYASETFSMGQQDPGQLPTSQQTVNIDKIEIKNDFKENAQPDRIAFTLVEQLKKVAENSRTAINGSLSSPLVGR